jgi:hypothetical protein
MDCKNVVSSCGQNNMVQGNEYFRAMVLTGSVEVSEYVV